MQPTEKKISDEQKSAEKVGSTVKKLSHRTAFTLFATAVGTIAYSTAAYLGFRSKG